MSKSSQSTASKRRRLDTGFESSIQGGRYDSIDDIISKSMIPKMEGMNLSLDQVQKRLGKLDRENKLLRKETENLKFKSSYVPTTVKIECPKCNLNMDGPNDFIIHLEKVHFYVEQECVIDKPKTNGLCHPKVPKVAQSVTSFGIPIPETSRPLRTGRIPRKSKPDPPNQITRQPNHRNDKVSDSSGSTIVNNDRISIVNFQEVIPPKPQIPDIPKTPKTPNSILYQNKPLVPTSAIHQSAVKVLDPLATSSGPEIIPRMRFQSQPNLTQQNFHFTLRQNPPKYSMNNSVVPSPNKDKTSPGQTGSIARARTAAPLFKTSPKLSKPPTPLNRRETHKPPNTSPIDLTESSYPEPPDNATSHQKQLFYDIRHNMSLPIPQLNVELNSNHSVVISWSLTKEQNASIVANYEIKGYQNNGKAPPPPIVEWKVIGVVQAMSPPMACTLQGVSKGKRHAFAVRSIDQLGCHGQFSEMKFILV